MGAQQALLGGALGPFTATGGSQFTDSGYTYHIMHADNPSPTANFVVTEGEADLTILVVGGGGGICGDHTGGGGAGGIAYAAALTTGPGTYTCAIGGGGPGGSGTPNAATAHGGNTTFAGHPVGTITGKGGGVGSQDAYQNGFTPSTPGGSGGGNGDEPGPEWGGGQATQPGTHPSPLITDYGNPGYIPSSGNAPGPGNNNGGGGGAGSGGPGTQGAGGAGQPFPAFPGPLIGPNAVPPTWQPRFNPEVGPTGLYGGGGGGGGPQGGGHAGGPGGGGRGRSPGLGQLDGCWGTGGGGGGTDNNQPPWPNGGNGIICIRYVTQ